MARMFERYATGKYSLKEISKLARADGFVYRKSGDAVPNSTMHKILRKRTYTGDYDYNGITYRGATNRSFRGSCGSRFRLSWTAGT